MLGSDLESVGDNSDNWDAGRCEPSREEARKKVYSYVYQPAYHGRYLPPPPYKKISIYL